MRWLMILTVVLVVVAAVWLWRRSQKASLDVDGLVRDQQASAEARRRLDEHRHPSDGGPAGGSSGVGGVWGM